MRLELKHGDCLEVLKTIPDNSIDSIVTDPPYHLTSIVKRFGKEGSAPAQYGTDGAFSRASKGFMGKTWDGGDIAQRPDVWIECLRVLKPGGHMVAFSGSRTYHRMAVAIEDAGFDIRDQIMWIYGSGFPKSHNIGKALDKLQGNEREMLGTKAEFSLDGAKRNPNNHREIGEAGKEIGHEYGYKQGWDAPITKGTSQWEGWGTALKPAHEPICLARKPLSEKSIVENVLKWGTGGLNIDVSRIGYNDDKPHSVSTEREDGNSWNKDYKRTEDWEPNNTGRWPSNIILDEEAGQILDEQSGISKSTPDKRTTKTPTGQMFGTGKITSHNDKGGASRFFYCPKTSKKDRDEGLDGFEEKGKGWSNYLPPTTNGTSDVMYDRNTTIKNNHPTVKPTSLMEYLIKLVTPVGGTVLDPFMGSGSTGKAAVRNGFDFIGIEREEEYIKIARARIKNEIKY